MLKKSNSFCFPNISPMVLIGEYIFLNKIYTLKYFSSSPDPPQSWPNNKKISFPKKLIKNKKGNKIKNIFFWMILESFNSSLLSEWNRILAFWKYTWEIEFVIKDNGIAISFSAKK